MALYPSSVVIVCCWGYRSMTWVSTSAATPADGAEHCSCEDAGAAVFGEPASCTPDCGLRECGPDPACEEPCGACLEGEICSAEGLCEPELVCEPGYADCVDGVSELCLDDGSAWAEPLPCNPASSPAFTYVFEPPYERCDGRDCVAIVAGESGAMVALLGNRDSYRTITLELKGTNHASETYTPAPGSWFVASERFTMVPPRRTARVPFEVVVPADTAPGRYQLQSTAILMSSGSSSGGVTFRIGMGKSLLVDVLAPGE